MGEKINVNNQRVHDESRVDNKDDFSLIFNKQK